MKIQMIINHHLFQNQKNMNDFRKIKKILNENIKNKLIEYEIKNKIK